MAYEWNWVDFPFKNKNNSSAFVKKTEFRGCAGEFSNIKKEGIHRAFPIHSFQNCPFFFFYLVLLNLSFQFIFLSAFSPSLVVFHPLNSNPPTCVLSAEMRFSCGQRNTERLAGA